MVAAMRDRGVSISLGEGFSVREGSDIREKAADLAIMAQLGVGRINTVSLDPDLARSFDQFGILAEMAAAAGIETTVEFGPGTGVPDLRTALDAVRAVRRTDFRLLIDTMHLVAPAPAPTTLPRSIPTSSVTCNSAMRRWSPRFPATWRKRCASGWCPGRASCRCSRSWPRCPATS